MHYLSLSLCFPVSFLVQFSFRFSFLVELDPLNSSFRNFFMGVCRIAESEGRAVHFGDLIPSDYVLYRLSEELFALAFSALSTWKMIKGFMASEGNSWPLVRFEDLPEGLSNRGEGDHFSKETSSVSGSSRVVGSKDSWVARSYFSIVDVEGLKRIRHQYQIPEDVVLRIPDLDERACSSKYDDVAFYESDFKVGLRFPMQPFIWELLDRLNLSPGQLALNAWRTTITCMVMWIVCSRGVDSITVDELLYCYKPCQIAVSPRFWTLNRRQKHLKLVTGLPSFNREWKDEYVFVYGDN